MPRSDDAYDLVHTYDQAKAGKSKTARPAVRELGRDGAPVRLFIQEVRDPALVNTPPSGVRYVFVDQNGDLRRKNPDGSDELAVPTAPTDASYLTVNSEAALTDERELATSSRVSVTDSGPDSTAEIDVVEGQIEAGNLAGSTGSAGEVLVTDGTDASFGAGPQNAPDWTQDSNSPQTDLNVTSATYTLAGEFDRLHIFVQLEDKSSSSTRFDLRLNGSTASEYFFTKMDGTTTTFADRVEGIESVSAGNKTSIELYMPGRFTGALEGGKHQQGPPLDGIEGYSSAAVSSPTTSLTIFSQSTFNSTIDVYGFDIGSGGFP